MASEMIENTPIVSPNKEEEKEKPENESQDVEKDVSNEENEPSEKESDEDEEMMGLLDRPTEVTGCRARKQVKRLEYNANTSKEKHDIPEGKGQKLGDCPRIEQQIQKTIATELKSLHRILFSRAGSANEIKKNIRKFSGFTFNKTSPEYERKKSMMEKLTTPMLKNVCEVIDIEKSGTKEDLIVRILDFLLDPKESGKKVVLKKKSASKNKKKPSEKKKSKKKQAKKDLAENIESSSAENESSESEKEENNEDEEKEEVSSAKGKKKIKAKSSSKEKKRKHVESSESDGEPSPKKSTEPTDEEIKNLIKKILDNADLHEITMKKVIKQVGEHYPHMDLSQRKSFIKDTIKSVIS